ncbi:tyrosine-type recombinase/integrase [Bradyrhizobium sp. PMVTL-01]|uniref:tyrosine-type recombinase/integrase n=1 Tax=Bradyrhizobium sp. PMVTL-01 TaxID=3434999 RepID=UPI003F6F0533
MTLGPWLRRFLCEHIVTERNLARNTRKSYRDTFSLLLPFASRKLRKPVDRLAVRDLTSHHVLQFLTHLEEDRGCSARTRNQRLAAIRAFARFIGSRDPAHVEWCGHIRSIASKKSIPPPVGWLIRTEMEAMLAVPDRQTRRGRSEYALLLFLYNTGAPVSEATQLKARDLHSIACETAPNRTRTT